MTNQQGAPEALRLAAEVLDWMPTSDTQRALWERHQEALVVVKAAMVEAQQPAAHVQNPAETEHVAGDMSKNGPGSNTAQQPAPSAAVAVEWIGVSSHHLLQRDGILGKAGDVVTARWPVLPQPSTTPQADSQPAEEAPCRIFLVTQHHSKDGKLQPRYGSSLFKVLSAHGTFDTAERAREDAENAYHALYPGYKQDGVQPFYSWVVQEMEVAPTSAGRAPADSVTAPAGGGVAAIGETVQFSDKSKAPPLEKARRYLKAMGDQRTNSAYFFDDGYPRRESAQDALATLAVLEQLAATPPAQAADSVLEDAARLERERICAAIKAEDDYCVDQGDYMLDSDDCIKIARGEWVRPDFAIDAARKQGGA